MDVVFEVSGRMHTVPERQATILAENLRVLARAESSDVELYALQAFEGDWRQGASALADAIEAALVAHVSKPVPLEGGAAEATYRVLRLMVGMEVPIDPSVAVGLRDALGAPVSESRPLAAAGEGVEPRAGPRFLTARELAVLLFALFVLAVATVVAAGEGIVSWYLVGPVYVIGSIVAGLLGLRVATTHLTGKAAWTLASVVWWAILLIPATAFVLVILAIVAAVN